MLLRSKLLLGLFGLALAVSATTVFAVSFSDEANAKRFGFSSSKKENSSSETGSAEKSKHGDDAGEGASEDSGFSFKPRKPSGEDDEGEKDAAQSSPPEENVTADKQNNQSGTSAVADNESVAKTKTKAKTKARRAPNPLAAAHPGMDVVVCEAGCANKSEVQEAVYMQPSPVKVAELKPSSTASTNGANEGEILCLGGCYDTPKAYRSAVPGANVAGQWMTSVVPTSAKPSSGSGEWMRRIDEGRKSPQPAVNVPTPSNAAPPAKAETN